MADFEHAMLIVLQHEGGYSNDPKDAGGETNFGICKRSYPKVDIKNLTVDGAKEIYRRDFWNPLMLDHFTSQSLANKVFDTCVNIGLHTGVKYLQRALLLTGVAIQPDGNMGPQSVAAINAANPDLLLQSYRHMLVAYYEGLISAKPANRRFERGWLARANS
jgi:lysozyme family protein